MQLEQKFHNNCKVLQLILMSSSIIDLNLIPWQSIQQTEDLMAALEKRFWWEPKCFCT